MVELITTVLVISVLASISVVAVGKITRGSQQKKVQADVSTLNTAISVYLANGGSLDGKSTVNEVLNQLKTSRSKSAKKLHVGSPSGRMIDVRIVAINVPSESWKERARYDVASRRFITSKTGVGVEFDHDESLNEAFFGIEERSNGAVNYAEESKWVWDYVAVSNPSGPGGPNQVPTTIPPPDQDPNAADGDDTDGEDEDDGDFDDGGGKEDPPKPPKPPKLPRPRFSLRSGGYPDSQFPLSVTITNVPASDDGTAIVKIGSGSWGPYSGSISIPKQPTVIRARFVTVAPEAFRDSNTRTASYYPLASSIDGSTEGVFHSPSGGENMQYELSNNGQTFTHGSNEYDPGDGSPPIALGDPNSLTVTSTSFTSPTPGSEFKLLDLTYYNGNSFYDSHAQNVKLKLTINIPSVNQSFDYDINMDLVNTQNDPSDPNASADFIRINNPTQNLGLVINGVSYRLSLRFYSADTSGFNTDRQFHVYEGNSAQTEIRGKFIAKP